ncbi:Acetylornithine deacetylase/Succinyl-diaminopimelate desuccinylase [Cohaesibacter sp. ES.047]|uniref:M20/M25/M40 family metallo-hydrolase n=1 Tax=Cohaesibacter sp. ES.047 TaxID=1798205 RepID=UPI000BB6CE06|nr:M20/M25/M40 family metallo-hydrolase [Cohaesibacter sp. ES.047]SNY92745.1 Acetylornithine deacetylase/Succinyl-diaminopimelate desuccinylase [Cohaesibacter sp. ES.047]
MTQIDDVLAHIDANIDASLARMEALVRFKSISTDAAFKDDCRKAAEWLAASLQDIGFDGSVRETSGHPMVVGHDGDEGEKPGPDVLFYGHYDVQPVDPLELWNSDPFGPAIIEKDGVKMMTGRGTSDDKGQLLTFLEACRAYKAVKGSLPVKVSILLEGEEESGSGSLLPFLEANKSELSKDLALVCDTTMFDPETPAITTMLRGLVGEEITITAADRDLHSGSYGGPAANPIRVLARILADLHDENGRVQIPDFYDGVPELSPEVKAQWDSLPFDGDAFLGNVGLSIPTGETGYSIYEQISARPTCEFNGITGGYTGDGFKTVIASKASAKLSCRLVGQQDPHAIRKNLRAFIKARVPADCSVDFAEHGASPAHSLSPDFAPLKQGAKALQDEWGKAPIPMGMGGSIPIVGEFKSILEMDSLLIGFGLDDDNIHSPNEKYNIESYHRGIRSWARVLAALAE